MPTTRKAYKGLPMEGGRFGKGEILLEGIGFELRLAK